MANYSVSRRSVLLGMAGVAGTLAVGSCGTTSDKQSQSGRGSLTPPAYVPYKGVTPDLPASDVGVPAAYFRYPEVVQRDGFPLPQTEPVTALLQGMPPSVPPDRNKAYEVFRKQAGNTMDATTITTSDYPNKLQVTLAGGDIPDLVQLQQVPQFPALLAKYFTDLSDVLGGDGVKRFPALANIPPATWKIPQVNGRLWGIAQPRPPAGRILSTRGDILASAGLGPNPEVSSGQDFVALLAELTHRDQNKFALGSDPVEWLLRAVLEMMGAPNGWAVVDGKFVSQMASEQMPEALSECAKIIKAGYLHPNSFSDRSQNSTWWIGGTTALFFQNFAAWGTFANRYPDWKVGYVRLPKWDGGGKASIFKNVAGYVDWVAIKKQRDDKRLEEILKIVDFIASPFGTQQYLDVNYGAPGFNYKMVDGNPQFLPDMSANIIVGWPYAGSNGQANLFVPGQDDLVKAQHAYLTEVLPDGVDDASSGLYSETNVTVAATWRARVKDLQRAIMQGEKPVSDWAALVKNWKADVGDKMAAEFHDAAAAG